MPLLKLQYEEWNRLIMLTIGGKNTDGLTNEQRIWCAENLTRKPLISFHTSESINDCLNVRMRKLTAILDFTNDADLLAFKLRWL